ncbi:hypothetical protein CBR_g23271 [Chara braunii]|uniref:Uncharacterized protein n=1 Tax=Chara braunii TaxID=69332 RepID=A0A388JVG2_CHABU|nr:hypothetical protein CBR_g23271 [Chara braunii]|eukprot:GBG61757.1 hypothetical protein CBR_g23271 [Chara braunii]
MAISRGDIGPTETMKKSGEIVVSDPYKPLKHFILQALSFKQAGDSSQYDMLLEYVKDLQDGDGLIAKVLSQCVSQIDEKDHYQLLLQMFKPSLWKCSSEVQDALLEFTIHLVSANGRCVQLCLEWLISNFFLPGRVPGSAAALAGGFTSSQEDCLARKEEVCEKLHGALQKVIELVPTVHMRLVPLILRRKPYRLLDKEMQCLYLENVLRLARESTGTLSNRLLVVVVDHLVEIDVEIRWELIMEEKSAKEILVFDVDLDDEQEPKEGDNNEWEVDLAKDGTEGAPGEEAILAKGQGRGKSFNSQSLQTLDAMADKMDSIMEMTFEYVQRQTEAGRLSEAFDALIHSFKTTILHTYKAKFVQVKWETLLLVVTFVSPLT